jgi:hypothetical protein
MATKDLRFFDSPQPAFLPDQQLTPIPGEGKTGNTVRFLPDAALI